MSERRKISTNIQTKKGVNRLNGGKLEKMSGPSGASKVECPGYVHSVG